MKCEICNSNFGNHVGHCNPSIHALSERVAKLEAFVLESGAVNDELLAVVGKVAAALPGATGPRDWTEQPDGMPVEASKRDLAAAETNPTRLSSATPSGTNGDDCTPAAASIPPAIPDGFALAPGWVLLAVAGRYLDEVDWSCTAWRCQELARYADSGPVDHGACPAHAVSMGALVPLVPAEPSGTRVPGCCGPGLKCDHEIGDCECCPCGGDAIQYSGPMCERCEEAGCGNNLTGEECRVVTKARIAKALDDVAPRVAAFSARPSAEVLNMTLDAKPATAPQPEAPCSECGHVPPHSLACSRSAASIAMAARRAQPEAPAGFRVVGRSGPGVKQRDGQLTQWRFNPVQPFKGRLDWKPDEDAWERGEYDILEPLPAEPPSDADRAIAEIVAEGRLSELYVTHAERPAPDVETAKDPGCCSECHLGVPGGPCGCDPGYLNWPAPSEPAKAPLSAELHGVADQLPTNFRARVRVVAREVADLEARLAYAEKRCREIRSTRDEALKTAVELRMERFDLVSKLAAAEKAADAERDGNMVLRRLHGARENETMGAFVERLAKEAAAADASGAPAPKVTP